jgi:hypothetical protein
VIQLKTVDSASGSRGLRFGPYARRRIRTVPKPFPAFASPFRFGCFASLAATLPNVFPRLSPRLVPSFLRQTRPGRAPVPRIFEKIAPGAEQVMEILSKVNGVEVTPPRINAPLVKNIILGRNALTVGDFGFREFDEIGKDVKIASARFIEFTLADFFGVTDTAILAELEDGTDEKTNARHQRIMMIEYESRAGEFDRTKELAHVNGILPMFDKYPGICPRIDFFVLYGPDVKPFDPGTGSSKEPGFNPKLIFLSQSAKKEELFANLDEKRKIGEKATPKETIELALVLDNEIFDKDSYLKILRYLADFVLFPDRAVAIDAIKSLDAKYRHLMDKESYESFMNDFMPTIFGDVAREGMKIGIDLGLAMGLATNTTKSAPKSNGKKEEEIDPKALRERFSDRLNEIQELLNNYNAMLIETRNKKPH